MKQPMIAVATYLSNNNTYCLAPTAGAWKPLGTKTIESLGEVMTAAGRIERLYVDLRSPVNGGRFGPGSGNDVTIAVYVNGVETDLSVTMGDSVNTANNTSDVANVSVGDVVTFVKTSTGASPTSRTTSMGYVFRGSVPLRSTYGGNIHLVNSSVRYFPALCANDFTSATRLTARGSSAVGTWGTLSMFMVQLSAAPGAGKSWTFAVLKNGVAITGASITVSGTDTTGSATFSETCEAVTITAGVVVTAPDELSIRQTPTGSPLTADVAFGLRYDATALSYDVGEVGTPDIIPINDNISMLARNLEDMYANGTSQYWAEPLDFGSAADTSSNGIAQWPDVDGADFNIGLGRLGVIATVGPGSGAEREITSRYWNVDRLPTAGFSNNVLDTVGTLSGTNTFTGATRQGAYDAATLDRLFQLRQKLVDGISGLQGDALVGYMVLADSYEANGAEFDGTVTSIVPDEGPTEGGTSFVITGTGFQGTVNSGTGNITGVSSVTLNNIAATSVVVVNGTTITGVSGVALTAGVGDVVINFTTDIVGNPPASGMLVDGWEYIETEQWWETNPGPGGPGTGPGHFWGTEPPSGSDPGGDLDWDADPTVPEPYGWWYSRDGMAGAPLVADGTGVPKGPRTRLNISAFATGTAAHLQGQPGIAVMYRNRLIYASRDYTTGTDAPRLRIFDGHADRLLTSVPPTSGGVAVAIMNIIVANGTIYFSTLDFGSATGRVFNYNLDTGILTLLGAAFTKVPYVLAWHNGQLWCGTNKGDATASVVYRIKPDQGDTTWTSDHTMSTETLGGVCSMVSFQGQLYVGSDNVNTANGKILVRSELAAYTVTETGTGTAAMNGYHSMVVFKDNLYAAYYNSAGAVMKIRKYTGTAWSTVYTGATTTARPVLAMFTHGGYVYALISAVTAGASLIRSSDGTTWVDLSAFLVAGDIVGTPAFGTLRL